MLGMLLTPLMSATPAAAAAATPPTGVAREDPTADRADRVILELPPPCPRFSHLPVQTPPLYSKRHAAANAVPATPAASAASATALPSPSVDSLGSSAAVTALRQGGTALKEGLGGLAQGVLSSGLGGRVLGGLGNLRGAASGATK